MVPEHTHGDQWGIVLQGTVRITIGTETHECHGGDTYFVPAGVPHRFVEFGTLSTLVIFTPPAAEATPLRRATYE